VKPRMVRDLVKRGFIAKPAFRGTATRYDSVALGVLLAVTRMRRVERLGYAAIRKRVGEMLAEELQGYVVDGRPHRGGAGGLGTDGGVRQSETSDPGVQDS